jgi:long-subunit fatty acid transport protein
MKNTTVLMAAILAAASVLAAAHVLNPAEATTQGTSQVNDCANGENPQNTACQDLTSLIEDTNGVIYVDQEANADQELDELAEEEDAGAAEEESAEETEDTEFE